MKLNDVTSRVMDKFYRDLLTVKSKARSNQSDRDEFLTPRTVKEIQKLLDRVDGTPEEALISRLALRSMKQARYTTENTGAAGRQGPGDRPL